VGGKRKIGNSSPPFPLQRNREIPTPMAQAALSWEISRLSASLVLNTCVVIPTCLSARDDTVAGSLQSFRKETNDAGASLPTVISTAAKRSGEISRLNGIACIVAGDLSTLSFNRIATHHFPYRHVPPLEMTQRRAAYSHSERKRMTSALPASAVISTAAKRSGEISSTSGIYHH
jgi:hypothetical protein